MMRKKLVLILFFAAILLPTLVWAVFGAPLKDAVPFNIEEKLKRPVYAFPDADSVLSGGAEFFAGVENWYGDRLPFYNVMMVGYDKVSEATNATYQTLVKQYADLVHTHHYTAVVKAPTCEAGGYTEYRCSCGDCYRADETEATGHDLTETVVAPTCTEEGCTLVSCKNCDYSVRKDETPLTAHSYKGETTPPTCEEDGYIIYTCSVCGASYREDHGDATGHDYVETRVEPTCTENGYLAYTCRDCGDTYRGDAILSSGHIWSAWTVLTDATAEKTGLRMRECTACHEKEEGVIPRREEGHVHEYVKTVIPATCTGSGCERYECSCGDSYETEIEPTGHIYKTEETPATCTKSGSIVYTCTVCGDSHSERLTLLGHLFSDAVTIAPTCEENGYDLRVCKRCGTERRSNTVYTQGHDWTSWECAKAATATETGLLKRSCRICGETEELVQPVLGAGERSGYTSNGTSAFLIGRLIDTQFNKSKAVFRVKDDIQFNTLNNWLMYVPSVTLADYQGQNHFTRGQMEKFAEKLQRLSDRMKRDGKKLVFTICPNKECIYTEYMDPKYPVFNEQSRVDELMAYLKENTDVIVVYAVDDLMKYKDTYQLWFKHDTHWNAAGGYVEAMNILDALGLPTVDLYDIPLEEVTRLDVWDSKDIDVSVDGNIIGSTVHGYYDHFGDIDLFADEDDTDYIIDFMPDVSYHLTKHYNRRCSPGSTNAYFTNPEYTNTVSVSDSENKQSCLVLGDSFRRSVLPYLMKSFAKVSAYHSSEISGVGDNHAPYLSDDNGFDFIANVEEADVIVIESVERGFSIEGSGNYIDTIYSLLGQ